MQAGELAENRRAVVSGSLLGDAHLDEKIEGWAQQHNRDSAVELVSAAILLEQHDLAISAAEFLETNADSTAAEKTLARAVLPSDEPRHPDGLVDSINVDREWNTSIRVLRALASRYPRNPFIWSELSRAHTSVGNIDKAKSAMRVAVQLAPNNRYIVRAATRLFIHFGLPDIAHAILLRYEGLKHDPWVLSAEIAAAGVLNKTSRFALIARRLIKLEQHSPFQLSELNGSLATLELFSGDHRAARRLFKSSLEQPTDNAVAQAVWASGKGQLFQIPPSALALPNTFEANTFKHQSQEEWAKALETCDSWLADEPYSRRAAETGSYLSLVAMDDLARSESFARRGLLANPDSLLLRNNLAVALAVQDRPQEALAMFLPLMKHADLQKEPEFHATRGLILYRSEQPDEGRNAYLHAMDLAKGTSNHRSWALAGCHILLEENRVRPENAIALLPSIQNLVEKAKVPEVSLMFMRVKNLVLGGQGSQRLVL